MATAYVATTVTTFIADDAELELLAPKAFTRYMEVLQVLSAQVLGEDLTGSQRQMERLEKSISIYDVVLVTEALVNNPDIVNETKIEKVCLPKSAGEFRRLRLRPESPVHVSHDQSDGAAAAASSSSISAEMETLSVSDRPLSWGSESELAACSKLLKGDSGGRKRLYKDVAKTSEGKPKPEKAMVPKAKSKDPGDGSLKLGQPVKVKPSPPTEPKVQEEAKPSSKKKEKALDRQKRRVDKARAKPLLADFPLQQVGERITSTKWMEFAGRLHIREEFVEALRCSWSVKDWRRIAGSVAQYHSEITFLGEGVLDGVPLVEEAWRWKRLPSRLFTRRVDVLDGLAGLKRFARVSSDAEREVCSKLGCDFQSDDQR